MKKAVTIFTTTSIRPNKDNAFIALRSQIDQAIHGPTATQSSASTGATTPSSTSPIQNTLPEAPTYYTTDGVVLYDDTGAVWGQIVSEIPVGNGSFLTEIQIHAVLDRINSTTFELPSHAQYVMDVWFDDLKAEPTNHYFFIPDSTISTVASLGSDVVVTALYLNKNEIV